MSTKVETTPKASTPAPEEGAGQPRVYRPDQGRLARMAAFWLLELMLLFGCNFLHGMLIQIGSMADAVKEIRIPVVGVDLSPAFLVSAALFAVGTVVILRWQQKPKVADLLIETEGELRRVTWPTGQEVVNTSIVVVVFVIVLGFFLAGCDWALARIMKYLVLGEV